MLEDVLFKGIKRPKQRKKKELQQDIKITGEMLPQLESFVDLRTKCVFKSPRLVQKVVIPYILNGKNICVESFTGSGKTLSFVLPLLELGIDRRVDALVLVPSDCLGNQIDKVISEIENNFEICREIPLAPTKGNRIVICKPEDLLNDSKYTLSFTHLIIDEADLMINKNSSGLFKSLSTCIDLQLATVCVFSATMNKEVERILEMFKEITKIYVSNKNSISHRFVFGTKDNIKHLSLRQIIEDGVEAPCLIFVKDVDTGRKLSQIIPNSGSFDGQESVLDNFRLKKIWYLFTTDVLARGVDFINVKSVINYDYPVCKTDFVHRAGRVNRNTTGQKVFTVYTIEDFNKLWYVVDFIKENGCRVEEHIEKIINKSKKSEIKKV
ncbi:putative ATP-dependent RNA helicase ddx52 [Nosema granulosis]|uniref:ATP-dependent RNA helicase n=1 Tax=Nosema granulosis TaxID=83296 RepID=A0A9P6H180_9MICR|nr:putative ATP-dependent RNA helicase ddx52 [Nosema granulosis]